MSIDDWERIMTHNDPRSPWYDGPPGPEPDDVRVCLHKRRPRTLVIVGEKWNDGEHCLESVRESFLFGENFDGCAYEAPGDAVGDELMRFESYDEAVSFVENFNGGPLT